jgi:hypothetical protein
MQIHGTLYIYVVDIGTRKGFHLTFARKERDQSPPPVQIESEKRVESFLQHLRINHALITGAMEDLESSGRATLANVDLPENELKTAGLVR